MLAAYLRFARAMPARNGSGNRMSRCGNANWGKVHVPAPHLPTQFEQQVEKLSLRPGDYAASPELRSWCRNGNIHCVPEYLLKLWGIKVNESWRDRSWNGASTGDPMMITVIQPPLSRKNKCQSTQKPFGMMCLLRCTPS
jgi:hypothetical protein